MALLGFNVGSTMSLNDISLAVDYLRDKESFEIDLQNIKDKISNNETVKENNIMFDDTF